MSGDQHAGHSHSITLHNSSFERVEQFKYLRMTLINENSIRKEIKSSLKWGNACNRSVQNLSSSSLLSKNMKIYNIVIFPTVLYGCGTWSLALTEERRLSVFEHRLLRRLFGPKRDEVTGERIKLHNAEVYDLHSSPHTIRVIKSRKICWVGHVARMRERRGTNRIMMGKHGGWKPLRRPRLRWEDNINMDLQDVGWGHGMERSGSG